MENENMSGACPFCGQYIEFEYPAVDEYEARDMAAERCNCAGARHERDLQKKIALACERIEALFGENASENGFEPIPSKEPISALCDLSSLVARGVISTATINISGKCTARVTLGNKGNIVIARREARACQLST